MRTAHLVSIGSEFVFSINPDCEDGYVYFDLSIVHGQDFTLHRSLDDLRKFESYIHVNIYIN